TGFERPSAAGPPHQDFQSPVLVPLRSAQSVPSRDSKTRIINPALQAGSFQEKYMQVSIETLSNLERKMTIEVPAERVESQVESRLQEAARTFHMKGFRKGKVPAKIIRERFGKGVRQEVLGEVMSQSYY